MKYCSATTLNHPISVSYNNCLEDINVLIKREGNKGTLPFFINKEIVINLDFVEKEIAHANRRSKKKSMDMAFGVSDKIHGITKMRMVELKLNKKSLKNLRFSVIKKKAHESKLVLSGVIPVHHDNIIIFPSILKLSAKRRLKLLPPEIQKNCIIKDIDELKAEYF